MIHRFIKLGLEALAAIAGNLIAAWIQNDLWSNLFTPARIIGTIIGAIVMLLLLALVDWPTQITIQNSSSEALKGTNIVKVDTAALREMLTASFDDIGLITLCFDNFRAVYEKFSQGLERSQKVQLLIDYCQRNGQTDQLLKLVEEKNPHQYHSYISRVKK